MFKKSILLGVFAGSLAGVASIIYQKVYASSLGEDFITIAKPVGIIASSVFAGLLAAMGYFLITKWLKESGEVVFNFVFVILTFASIMAPFATTLPLEVETPELFPGLIVPMHFFPALAWFTLKPLFIKSYDPYKKVFG
jgi:hypothetical protein